MSEAEKINETGRIKIADNVAASIANLAAQEVQGVVKVIGSSTTSVFGKEELSKRC